jgi:hypothetical protein
VHGVGYGQCIGFITESPWAQTSQCGIIGYLEQKLWKALITLSQDSF